MACAFCGMPPGGDGPGCCTWEFKVQTMKRADRDLAALKSEREAYRAALQRLADCDFVITPADRMDAVREIARAALSGTRRVE